MLFVIEANPTMLRDDRDRTKISQAVDALDEDSDDGAPQWSLMLGALKLVHKTVRRKLKQSPTDKIGILVFNMVRWVALNSGCDAAHCSSASLERSRSADIAPAKHQYGVPAHPTAAGDGPPVGRDARLPRGAHQGRAGDQPDSLTDQTLFAIPITSRTCSCRARSGRSTSSTSSTPPAPSFAASA